MLAISGVSFKMWTKLFPISEFGAEVNVNPMKRPNRKPFHQLEQIEYNIHRWLSIRCHASPSLVIPVKRRKRIDKCSKIYCFDRLGQVA